MKENHIDIQVHQEDPLILSSTVDNKTIYKVMDSKLDHLNENYVCIYSLEKWCEALNSCFGLAIKYSWKEQDDWAPSRATIEHVSPSSFISIEGYNEVQTIFGNVEMPSHTTFYGKSSAYVKSAHDQGNAVIPIATDPFFINKVHIVKEKLAHMVAGSSLAFRKSHSLFYISVLKQAFYQLIETDTNKLREIIMLLLNTFRLLHNHMPTIYDKDNAPLSNSTILYNIFKGNTAPYLFNGNIDSCIFTLICSEMDYQKCLEKINTETNGDITLVNMKKKIWEMCLRHFIMHKHQKKDHWESPQTWGLLSQNEIKEKIKEEGQDALPKYLMSSDKLKNIPSTIVSDLTKIRDSKTIKIFKTILQLADSLDDNTWNIFNSTFTYMDLNLKSTQILETHFTDQIFDYYNYWTYWELAAYGPKECFPSRSIDEISRIIANIINIKFSENLSGMLADIRELLEYKARDYETRYLPVTFTYEQQNTINDIFTEVYSGKITEEEFKSKMYILLGDYYTEIIKLVLETDKIDVLKNLYQYCLKRQHSIVIKNESKLPFSAPANPSSPYFLQYMTHNEFREYYKPLGFGWSTKKYSSWISDLHPYMVSQLPFHKNEDSFVENILKHISDFKSYNERDMEHYKQEIKHFYQQFKNNNSVMSTKAYSQQKNYNFYFP